MKKALFLGFVGVFAGLLTISPALPAAATTPALWCWSMNGGSVKGTFLMSPDTAGDGTAAAGTYTLTGFSVYESNFARIPSGSIADGIYVFGSQPTYQVIWSGSAATTWQRASGLLTNGFGIYSGTPSTNDYLVFDTNYQSASVYGQFGSSYTDFQSAVTPTLQPAAASGLCPGQTGPTSSPTQTASAATLPNTGAHPAGFILAGATLVIAGLMILATISRRRKTN